MNKKYLLIVILIIAAVLRFWGLQNGDPRGDEVFYGFRAIGPLDFDNAPAQPTPLEFLSPNTPWWTSLSFHDHPPLVFWVQHFFINLFGENVFAFRLPSAILGVVSVYLLYLVGSLLISRRVGLLSAALLAVTVNNVFISRVGLQESYVIFFTMLAVYFFLKALQEDKYLIWMGVALGLAFLTKYTTFILIPIFFIYLLFFKRDYFRNAKLWFGALAAILIFSPVIIYNLMLYKTVGHFDFQLSYVLGQDPEVWKSAPGKEEVGSLLDRARNFIPNLLSSNSWLFLALFGFSIPFFRKNKFFLISIIFLILWIILFIGPTVRFLTILAPFMALSIANFLEWIINFFKNSRYLQQFALLAITFLFVFELFYSINSQITYYPIGSAPLVFSEKARYENYNWGYNEFGDFLNKELKGKIPALSFKMRHQFLNDIQTGFLVKARKQGLESYSAIIIYDQNILNTPQLWFLDRLQIYHGWPVISTEMYSTLPNKNAFENRYFIIPTDKVPLKKETKLTIIGSLFEQKLLKDGITPTSIFNKRAEEAFRVYKF